MRKSSRVLKTSHAIAAASIQAKDIVTLKVVDTIIDIRYSHACYLASASAQN